MSTPTLTSVRTGNVTEIHGKAATCPDCGKALLLEAADLTAAQENLAFAQRYIDALEQECSHLGLQRAQFAARAKGPTP